MNSSRSHQTVDRRLLQLGLLALTGTLVNFDASTTHGDDRWDVELRRSLGEQGVRVPDSGLPEEPDAHMILLGQALFFDHELSGNRDIACATCHHPALATSDALSLPVGTGAVVKGVLGQLRQKGPNRKLIPRNSPDIFNRGSPLWNSLFWDSRVALNDDVGATSSHQVITPAGADLPAGLSSVLAAQAMFPVTSRDEMRGNESDENELAAIDDEDLPAIWNALAARLLDIPGYRTLFGNAYGIADADLDTTIGFEHAANAIAAFEAEAFTFLDSPFDQYLAGDDTALSAKQKRGALLFYGQAKCSQCHSGPLMTDQRHYNLMIPHLGPGKMADGEGPPDDTGLALLTLNVDDVYRFRTPPLRNVAKTGPYMHNGAYTDLEEAVRHHFNIVSGFSEYDPLNHVTQLDAISDPDPLLIAVTMPGDLSPLEKQLTKKQFKELMSFLKSLTAPQLKRRLEAVIPESVPSGLPLDDHRRNARRSR